MQRDFNTWLSTMTNSVASWSYYTDFSKVYTNVDSIKVELNLLNSLVGSKNVKQDFIDLVSTYPQVLSAVPILIAKREHIILIRDALQDFLFDFSKTNYDINEYAMFMEKTGIFNLLSHRLISNLYDYVAGVEAGLDSNGRKNRTGHTMENLVEDYLIRYGFEKNVTYFKELRKSQIERMWGIDLSAISNNGKTEKRFDFVVKTDENVYGIEVNFYSGGGSKLNETARSYKGIALEAAQVSGFSFIWITDGKGWNSARHNLEETFDILDKLYNLNDLEEGRLATSLI